MIHICYGLFDRDGRYSKFAGTSIASIFENTHEPVTIHLFHDNSLTFENRVNFNNLVNKYNQQLQFYNVELLATKEIEEFKKTFAANPNYRYSIASLYRLFIPKLISNEITKIIYFDADIIVNCDIDNFWNINLVEYPLAAVPEYANGLKFALGKHLITSGMVDGEDYLNSGVLLLNLDKIRNDKKFMNGGIPFILEYPQCIYLVQDFLNYCFAKNYLKLPMDFNIFVDVERVHRQPCKLKKAIYHFLSNSFQADANDIFNRMYLEYFTKTPWFNVDMFDNIFKMVTNERDNLMYNIIHMSSVVAVRRRAFFTSFNYIQGMKQLFSISENETIVDASSFNAIQNAVDKIGDKRSQTILFVLVDNYLEIRNALIAAGFIENVDFLDVRPLLSTKFGNPFKPDYIVRSM